jgi:hypothetical protein
MSDTVGRPEGGLFVVGYVLEKRATDLKYTRQTQKINEYCKKEGFVLIFTEQEVGEPKNICRSGLWRVTRALVCYECDPGVMPISYDVEAWVQRAMQPCRCKEPVGVHGFVAADIKSLCSDPVSGSKFALALAIQRKHLFLADEKRCISCCNPAAKPFMERSLGL